jgi:hypothetical protein
MRSARPMSRLVIAAGLKLIVVPIDSTWMRRSLASGSRARASHASRARAGRSRQCQSKWAGSTRRCTRTALVTAPFGTIPAFSCSRLRPAFCAAWAIFVHSPETMRSIAVRTLAEMRLGFSGVAEEWVGEGQRRDVFHDRHHRWCRLCPHQNITFYVLPNLIEWFWNQILRYTFKHFLRTDAHLLLDACGRRSSMFGGKTKFQSEKLMADVYLGIMIAGVNTLIVLGAALAFVVI